VPDYAIIGVYRGLQRTDAVFFRPLTATSVHSPQLNRQGRARSCLFAPSPSLSLSRVARKHSVSVTSLVGVADCLKQRPCSHRRVLGTWQSWFLVCPRQGAPPSVPLGFEKHRAFRKKAVSFFHPATTTTTSSIHTKVRNGLSQEKACKLSLVCFNSHVVCARSYVRDREEWEAILSMS
jgi:hypothetical protein